MRRRAVAGRLYDGSGTVASRIGCAFVPQDRPVATAVRLGGGAVILPHLLNLIHQQPVWAAAGACAWCLAAWRASAPSDANQSTPEITDETETEPHDELENDDEPEDVPADAFLRALHRLLPNDDSRIHLAQVADHLYGDPKATGPVRELCAATGVTITRGVRVPGREVSTGIHWRDLPRLPAPSQETAVAVVAAGQSEQQQQQHVARIVPDPTGGPNRWRVEWDDEPAREAS